METQTLDENILSTSRAPEYRLQRIEFFLGCEIGRDDKSPTQDHQQQRRLTYLTRLKSLEKLLEQSRRETRAITDLLNLCEPDVVRVPEFPLTQSDQHYPEAFPSHRVTGSTSIFTILEKLEIVLAYAILFPTALSRLNSIQDSSLPTVEAFRLLTNLVPRLLSVEHRLESTDQEIADLRCRTMLSLQRWYEIGVLCHSECWSDWEERLLYVEQLLRRQEASIDQYTAVIH